MLQSTGMQRVRDDLATEQQSNTEQWEICLRFKYLFWASVATTMNTYLFGTLLMDCNHVFMTIGNNMYDENLHKLKKRNILNTILIVQVVLLGLYSLVLQRYWNTPSETNEKCKFYIIHCQLLILALVCVCAWSVAQLCLTLCNPLDCSPPGSSVYGIFQSRTGVPCHLLLQGIFPTQGSNPHHLCLLY